MSFPLIFRKSTILRLQRPLAPKLGLGRDRADQGRAKMFLSEIAFRKSAPDASDFPIHVRHLEIFGRHFQRLLRRAAQISGAKRSQVGSHVR